MFSRITREREVVEKKGNHHLKARLKRYLWSYFPDVLQSFGKILNFVTFLKLDVKLIKNNKSEQKLLQFVGQGILQRICMQNLESFAFPVQNGTPARLENDQNASDPPFWTQLPVERHMVLAI